MSPFHPFRNGKLGEDLDLKLEAAETEQISEHRGTVRFFPDGSSTGGHVILARGGIGLSSGGPMADRSRPYGLLESRVTSYPRSSSGPTCGGCAQGGFSLLEVVVAFAILVLSLGLLIQIFSRALNTTVLSGDYSRAATLAQAHLNAEGIDIPLEPGSSVEMRRTIFPGRFPSHPMSSATPLGSFPRTPSWLPRRYPGTGGTISSAGSA